MEIPKKEREVFEDQIIADGFVEFSGYSLKKDEFEGYVDERVECAWFAYSQAFRRATEQSQAVPEGFVLVPKEPTEEMIRMGDLAFAYDECVDARKIYKAMIEAQEQSHENG